MNYSKLFKTKRKSLSQRLKITDVSWNNFISLEKKAAVTLPTVKWLEMARVKQETWRKFDV